MTGHTEEPWAEPKAPLRHSAEPWMTEAFNEIECSTGEPDYSAMILAGDGESIIAQQMSDYDADRATACVNALAGYPDPTAFVAAAMGMREALSKAVFWDSHDAEEVPAVWLDDAQAALATFRTAMGEAE